MSENPTQQLPDDPLQLILSRLDSISAGLAAMGERLTSVESRIDALEQRMTALEEKVDRRLAETRPIWEAVLARLDKIEERMTALEKRMDNLELDTRAGFRRVERVMGDAAKYLLEV